LIQLDKQGQKRKVVESLPELQLADHLISQRRNTYQQFPHHYMRENGGSGENNYHTVNRYGYNYNRPRLWQIIQEESERRYAYHIHQPLQRRALIDIGLGGCG
jgi:hypothetical protein